MSVNFGYPQWGEFFKRFVDDAVAGAVGAGVSPLPQKTRVEVIAFVENYQYEEGPQPDGRGRFSVRCSVLTEHRTYVKVLECPKERRWQNRHSWMP